MREDDYRQGHRERIRKRYKDIRFEGSSEVEVLEFMLCFAIPRRDVKPIAYALIKHFGNLQNVFSADIEDLKNISGIGETSALLLTSIWESSRFARIHAMGPKQEFVHSEAAGKYVYELLYGRKTEAFYMLLLDAHMRLIHTELISEGSSTETPIYISEIVSIASRRKAKMVILAHNHPGGTLKPSPEDYELTEQITQALSHIGVGCVDHIIVTDDGFYAMVVDEEYSCREHDNSLVFAPKLTKPQNVVKQTAVSQGDLVKLAEILYHLQQDEWETLNGFVGQMRDKFDDDLDFEEDDSSLDENDF